MGEHLRFTVETGGQAYFCDPRSPPGWQSPAEAFARVVAMTTETAGISH